MTDQLFLETGVHHEDLHFCIGKLEMDKDEEFISLINDYTEQVELLQK